MQICIRNNQELTKKKSTFLDRNNLNDPPFLFNDYMTILSNYWGQELKVTSRTKPSIRLEFG